MTLQSQRAAELLDLVAPPAATGCIGLHGLRTRQHRREYLDNPSVRPSVCLSFGPSNRMTAGGLAVESIRCHGVVTICRSSCSSSIRAGHLTSTTAEMTTTGRRKLLARKRMPLSSPRLTRYLYVCRCSSALRSAEIHYKTAIL